MNFSSDIFKSKITRTFLLVLLIYNSIFNSLSGQFLFNKINPYFHSGVCKANVSKFSLFYGIELENLTLSEKEENSPFLKVSRLAFLYSLPELIIGSININEIALENTEINIKKNKNIYNYENIFKTGPSKEKANIEENKTDFLKTYLYIKLSSFINIKNFNIRYEDEENNFSLNNLNTNLSIVTNRFNIIYFNEKSLDLLNEFTFEIQPSRSIPIQFKNNEISLNENIGFNFLLKTKEENSFNFHQTFYLQLNSFSPLMNGKKINPLNISIDINSSLNKNRFTLQDISFIFQGSKFIKGSGSIEDISNIMSVLSFSLEDSMIDLDLIHNAIQIPIFPLPKMSGKIYLSPLEIKGTTKEFTFKWNPLLENMNVSLNKSNHSISNGKILFEGTLGSINNKFTFKKIHFLISNLKYNSMNVNSEILFVNNIINGFMDLQKINLNQFSRSVNGFLSANIKIIESNINLIRGSIKSNIENFQIPIDNYHLKPSKLQVTSDIKIKLDESFELNQAKLENLNIELLNYNSGKSLQVITDVIQYEFLQKKVTIQNLEIIMIPEKMTPLLPYSLGEKISNINTFLGKEIVFKSNLTFSSIGEKQLKGNVEARIPGINLNDLTIKINMKLNSEGNSTIQITEFSTVGYENRLHTSVEGKIFTKNDKSISDLKLNFSYISNSLKTIFSNFSFKGKIESNISINENFIIGSFNSNQSDFIYNKGSCPGKDCKFINIFNFTCNIPIIHELDPVLFPSILDGSKDTLIRTKGMEKGNNFSIDSILGNHPIYPETAFPLVQGSIKNSGVVGRIEYLNNLFSISNLVVKTLNGSISSKNIQLNIANGQSNNFEFLGNLQVRDIDLTELIPKDNKKVIDDGKIRGDINFSGKNLKEFIDNTEIYFSVYKIGKDFGKSAINIVSPPNLIRDYIVSSYSVDKIEAELSKGLIYVNILFKPSLLSNLLTKIENNKISMERMPLNNFINRAENEISTYK